MEASGFSDVVMTAVNEPVWFGADSVEALAFVRRLGLTRALLHDLDNRSTTLALDRLHEVIAEHTTTEGVVFSGSAWLVAARKL
jgi:hypothetical protein